MTRRAASPSSVTVQDLCAAIEELAPPGLAQAWDNVGLLAGDPTCRVRRVLLCIDLTDAVATEAIKRKADLVLAYHPPIFKPISALRADSRGPEAAVFRCIRAGVAVYSTHTALDAADGGTNDVLASLCGIDVTEPIETVDQPGAEAHKLAVFVPAEQLEPVAGAMFDAGAGVIGDYTRCSFRTEGEGTFLGGDTTNPAIGRRGRMESVPEIRLEVVVPRRALAQVVRSMVEAHPYEEPAFDIYPLTPKPVRGIGRVGALPRPISLAALARKLKRATGARVVQLVGAPRRRVDRAVIVVGAAGRLPFRVGLRPADVIITGEIRHHDALAIGAHGGCAIALGHWSSERPVLSVLARRLRRKTPRVTVSVSAADRDPFRGFDR